jgi:PST family polysaccharide transporter
VQTGLLNAAHRVSALATYTLLAGIIASSLQVAVIWRWREGGIAVALLAGTAAGCMISTALSRKHLPRPLAKATSRHTWTQARSLIQFGLPYTGSLLVSAGVLIVMPVLVLHVIGSSSVGYYRAAATIAVTYLGFLLAAMSQDYFPRVSAVRDRPMDLCRLINEQQRMLVLLAMPIILLALALVPIIVPLLYSPKFSPASSILEWQLAGDVFRLVSWTFSFVILARGGSAVFFATEAIGGGAILAGSWVGMHHVGVAGTGIGYLVGYAIYFAVVWAIVRRDIELRLTSSNRILLATSVGSVAIVRALPFAGLTSVRLAVALLLSAGFGLYSLRAITSEFGFSYRELSWRRLKARMDA